MTSPLSAEDLYAQTDDAVKATVVSTFGAQLCNSGSVASTFFAGASTPAIAPVNPGFVDNVAVGLVCSGIARSSLRGFSATVDRQKADNYWQTQLQSPDATAAGQALYAWAFPDYCRSADHSFGEYLNNNPQGWAQQLASYVTTDAFVNGTINKLIAGEPNWLEKLNLIFYKLYRLDASTVPGVLNIWTTAYPDKGIAETWQSHNFVPSDKFQADQFLGQVNQAISVVQESSWTSPSQGGPGGGGPITYTDDTYGQAVVNFLSGKPTQLGLTTGQQPDNQTQTSTGGGFGCFVAGTPVLLASGESLPIEQIREHHEVLAKDGQVSTHTDERVVVYLEHETRIFGINEYAPFFSAGHLFWTRQGWKALDPAIAREENPQMAVSQLVEGDVLLRVAGISPLTYEEVPVMRITSEVLPAGGRLYGMHLNGHRSYHAHGFLVAMNYPMITEKRLRDGFATLTVWERRLIARQLAPVMPLLSKAVGRFIGAPLNRALSDEPASE